MKSYAIYIKEKTCIFADADMCIYNMENRTATFRRNSGLLVGIVNLDNVAAITLEEEYDEEPCCPSCQECRPPEAEAEPEAKEADDNEKN